MTFITDIQIVNKHIISTQVNILNAVITILRLLIVNEIIQTATAATFCMLRSRSGFHRIENLSEYLNLDPLDLIHHTPLSVELANSIFSNPRKVFLKCSPRI
jgi:hypothetical protein